MGSLADKTGFVIGLHRKYNPLAVYLDRLAFCAHRHAHGRGGKVCHIDTRPHAAQTGLQMGGHGLQSGRFHQGYHSGGCKDLLGSGANSGGGQVQGHPYGGMKESGIGYGAVNHPVDRDPVCGYNGIIDNECPKCHRREEEGGPKFERIRRITGYLVGTMDRWNDAKRAEEHDRVKHGV